jgi:enamine deaminase RidA (YjgF/YER057c/UK114 family)
VPKRIITSDKVYTGALPFAPATVAGGFMFVCCVGVDPNGRVAPDVKSQTQQCIDNIKALIEAAGGTLDDVVKCTVYVTARADWQPMNDVYFANFRDNPPHRVSCIVAGLGRPEYLVEIDATAYLGDHA